MEDSSHLFSYNINYGSDGEYQMLGDSGAGAHDYNQYFSSSTFPPLNDFAAPMRPHARSAQPSTNTSSSLPTHAHMQSGVDMHTWTPVTQGQGGQLQVRPAYGSTLESPGLSSGSSTTPGTKHSQGIPLENSRGSRNVSIQPKIDAVFPPPPPQGPILPPRKRKPRKSKSKPHLTMEEEEAKRNKTLERNRAAASKCREKKKDRTKDLEETKIGLESQHSHLQMEYSTLVNEVGEIRAKLMTHASCHDPNINKWIEARRFVLGAAAGKRYDAAMVGAATGPPSSNLDGAQGSMPVSTYAESGSSRHFDPSTYRTSLTRPPPSAAMPSSPGVFQGHLSSPSSGFRVNSNDDDLASHITQRTSVALPHSAVHQGSPSFQDRSISEDTGGEYLADAAADFSYGTFQATQEEPRKDENDLGFFA